MAKLVSTQDANFSFSALVICQKLHALGAQVVTLQAATTLANLISGMQAITTNVGAGLHETDFRHWVHCWRILSHLSTDQLADADVAAATTYGGTTANNTNLSYSIWNKVLNSANAGFEMDGVLIDKQEGEQS